MLNFECRLFGDGLEMYVVLSMLPNWPFSGQLITWILLARLWLFGAMSHKLVVARLYIEPAH